MRFATTLPPTRRFFSRIVALIPAVTPGGRLIANASCPLMSCAPSSKACRNAISAIRAPEQIAAHFRMAMQFSPRTTCNSPTAPCARSTRSPWSRPDRPGLFADVAGVLSAWGMNIVKADAFSNAAGIIVDTFQFTDTYRTLELNASEIDRFSRDIRDAVERTKSPSKSCCERAS